MMSRWFAAVAVGIALGFPATAHDGSGYYVFATEAGISIRHSTYLKT